MAMETPNPSLEATKERAEKVAPIDKIPDRERAPSRQTPRLTTSSLSPRFPTPQSSHMSTPSPKESIPSLHHFFTPTSTSPSPFSFFPSSSAALLSPRYEAGPTNIGSVGLGLGLGRGSNRGGGSSSDDSGTSFPWWSSPSATLLSTSTTCTSSYSSAPCTPAFNSKSSPPTSKMWNNRSPFPSPMRERLAAVKEAFEAMESSSPFISSPSSSSHISLAGGTILTRRLGTPSLSSNSSSGSGSTPKNISPRLELIDPIVSSPSEAGPSSSPGKSLSSPAKDLGLFDDMLSFLEAKRREERSRSFSGPPDIRQMQTQSRSRASSMTGMTIATESTTSGSNPQMPSTPEMPSQTLEEESATNIERAMANEPAKSSSSGEQSSDDIGSTPVVVVPGPVPEPSDAAFGESSQPLSPTLDQSISPSSPSTQQKASPIDDAPTVPQTQDASPPTSLPKAKNLPSPSYSSKVSTAAGTKGSSTHSASASSDRPRRRVSRKDKEKKEKPSFITNPQYATASRHTRRHTVDLATKENGITGGPSLSPSLLLPGSGSGSKPTSPVLKVSSPLTMEVQVEDLGSYFDPRVPTQPQPQTRFNRAAARRRERGSSFASGTGNTDPNLRSSPLDSLFLSLGNFTWNSTKQPHFLVGHPDFVRISHSAHQHPPPSIGYPESRTPSSTNHTRLSIHSSEWKPERGTENTNTNTGANTRRFSLDEDLDVSECTTDEDMMIESRRRRRKARDRDRRVSDARSVRSSTSCPTPRTDRAPSPTDSSATSVAGTVQTRRSKSSDGFMKGKRSPKENGVESEREEDGDDDFASEATSASEFCSPMPSPLITFKNKPHSHSPPSPTSSTQVSPFLSPNHTRPSPPDTVVATGASTPSIYPNDSYSHCGTPTLRTDNDKHDHDHEHHHHHHHHHKKQSHFGGVRVPKTSIAKSAKYAAKMAEKRNMERMERQELEAKGY